MDYSENRSRTWIIACSLVGVFAVGGVSNSATGATLNLNAGESVTLIPNVQTVVTCGAGPYSDCSREIGSLKSRFAACKRGYSSTTCFANEWPAFKSRAPHCVSEAFDACVELCEEGQSSATCYMNCR